MAPSVTPSPSGHGRYRVCLVSDFFFPRMGGVESHLFMLAQCLLDRGHSVIVVTHYYGNRRGIRWMTNALKVYYLPLRPFYNECVLPTIIGSLPAFRSILRRERIQIVHGHSAFSTLAHESMFVASLMQVSTVFTDHSLFGFADVSAVVTNAFLRFSLANADHCICVSHTGKENTVLRSGVPKNCVSVIPNAVDSDVFQPDFSQDDSTSATGQKKNKVTVVIGSRLVYRKGIDLVVLLIPKICRMTFKAADLCNGAVSAGNNNVDSVSSSAVNGVAGQKSGVRLRSKTAAGNSLGECSSTNENAASRYTDDVTVDFLVAGDGPKRILFEEMIESHCLQSRVTMLGELNHSRMREHLLLKGDIFLNTSLTEAFCMAILEAVSCGLAVVSTRVGGIPEVLPDDQRKFVYLAEPDVDSIERGLVEAVKDVVAGRRPSKRQCHEFVKQAYNWREVTARTELVYDRVLKENGGRLTLGWRLRRLWERGTMAGPLLAMLFLFCHYMLLLFDWLDPIR